MTNYSRGRAREYKTMQLLRARGFVCTRSAMSHGPVDIVAAKGGKILLVQVKSGSARVKKQELTLLKKWAVAFNAEAQVWTFKKRGLVKVTVSEKSAPRGTIKTKGRFSVRSSTTESVASSIVVLPESEAIQQSLAAGISSKDLIDVITSRPLESVQEIHPPSVA